MPTATPFKDLAGYMDKQTIACVEGRISKVQDKIASGTHPQYGDWSMQFGSFVDSSNVSHNWTIADSNLFLSQEDVGTTIRYESMPQSKGGPAGVTMSIRNDKQGNPQRSIKIDNRACVTRGGDRPASAPYTSSGVGQSTPTQGRGVSEQSRASVEAVRDQSTVDERLDHQFRLFEAAWKRSKATEKELGITFTVEDIRAFTNTIGSTFRGEYGSYAAPVWEKVVAADWKTVKTASGKALGEMSDSELAALTLKIIGLGAKAHEEPKTKAGLDAVLAAVKEKEWEPVKVAELAFELLPGGGTEFYTTELFVVACKDAAVESELELTLQQWASVFSDPKKLIEACKEQDSIPF